MEGDPKQKLLITKESSSEEELTLVKRVWEESKLMWVVAAPGIFTRFSTFGINVITQAFVGHIGSRELAAFALVYTVLVRFVNGILLGMATALSTLCGQAFGAKEYGMMGVYLQRSWIVLFLTAFILLPLFIFTRPIFILLGQDESIAEVAGTISLWSIPIMFAFIVSFTCQTFLQSQSKNVIIAFLAAFSIIFHVCLSWLLVIKLNLGLPSAIVATSLAYWIPNIGQLIFVTCGWCHETWKGFSFLAFRELWPVVKLSLSAGAMLCLELWYNTILVLLTGNMKNAEVEIDALSICLNINGWEMMISLGFMAAARERLAYIFTSNKEVADAVGDLSPLLSISILLNSVQPVLSGVAIGAGWQSIVAYVNIGCYYVVGIPVGIVLGKVIDLQVKGIWIGMLFGTFVQTLVLTIITYKTNWDEQVNIARNRVNRWSKMGNSDQETKINTPDD
ncbi:PREDICTED: protein DETOXIFICATION 21-like isoform X2 [Lupinus angustifolius]|uniref:protein DETOXIFICATION 21-like isoform X1 n=1 Tax=Lupinus angustifolius TaxID=3871 RepID=UPI00092E84C3|nr:PREDICTED: protein DETOXIFICATION 21-like isoform X1 [Lupinus angustifolius]XP_019457194.1 PREDICTED: protein DETOXIFICATION 21-like isoform X2 [Lupinus angustifolius]